MPLVGTRGILVEPIMRKGFSLLELIIYIAITIMIVTVLSETVMVMLRVRERNLAEREVQQNLRFVMSRLERAITQATAVTVSDATTLSLTIAGADPTVFSVSSGALQINEAGAGAISLTTSKVTVSAFPAPDAGNMFTKIAAVGSSKTSVRIKIKVDYVTGGKTALTASASAQTTVELRQI